MGVHSYLGREIFPILPAVLETAVIIHRVARTIDEDGLREAFFNGRFRPIHSRTMQADLKDIDSNRTLKGY